MPALVANIMSGEGGIRTHDTLRYTRFPSGRVRPTALPLQSPGAAISAPGERDYTINPYQQVIISGQGSSNAWLVFVVRVLQIPGDAFIIALTRGRLAQLVRAHG